MKYIYIVGLEHSGTTLVNHLIAQHNDAIGLGEVSSFFSPKHMCDYMERWGNCADVRLCSCCKDWDKCDFWGEVIELNGLQSDCLLKDKYRVLISYIQSKYGNQVVIVDSSKDIGTLKVLVQYGQDIGFEVNDLIIVMMVKDVRNFTTSIYRKSGSKPLILNYLRTFNWWLGVNKNILDYLVGNEIRFVPVLYERLCNEPEFELKRIFDKIGLVFTDEISLNHRNSHIAIGNKDFIMRNRNRISYDNRWFLEDGIQTSYLLHRTARHFNKKLYML